MFHSLIFMVDLITNLMNRSHHKYEIKKYHSLYSPENTSELFVWIRENLSPNWLDWDKVHYLDMGLNFDLTVERGKVAFTVSLINPCKATKVNPKIKKAVYPPTKRKKKKHQEKKALLVIIDSHDDIFLSSNFLCRTHRFNVLLGMY